MVTINAVHVVHATQRTLGEHATLCTLSSNNMLCWHYGVGGLITRTPPRAASLGEAARQRDPHHAKSKDIKPSRVSIRNLALNIKTTGGAKVAGRPRPPPCVRARRAGHPQRVHHSVAGTRGVQRKTRPSARCMALGPSACVQA